MRIFEVQEYLTSLDGGWVHYTKTVDNFKFGDASAELRGVAVGWVSYYWALQEAVQRGCNLFITHEPTFYDHLDQDPNSLALEAAQKKKQLMQQSGLAVLRCHDLWDQYPREGVPDAWVNFLGLGPVVGGNGYYRLVSVDGLTAGEVARRVAQQTKSLGQDAVQLLGDADRVVHRVGLGTGAITPFRHLALNMGADLVICSDDGFTYWRDGVLAIDTGTPVIVVHHQVTEEYGIELLANRLRQRLAPIPVHHIGQRCMFQLVSSQS